MEITVRACAKINLTLDVFNRRADGYHSLASVVQTVSLHDRMTIAAGSQPGVRLTVTGEYAAGVPADASNLVVKAVAALLAVAHVDEGLNIVLCKGIPSQAGLGGGSSDAAAALLGVTHLLGLDVGPKLLHTLAAQLGSDVPFFLSGGTAVMRGRGESVSPIAAAPPLWFVIVKPDEAVSTAWAYDALDAQADRTSNRATKFIEDAVKTEDRSRLINGQSNDFEVPVFRKYPKIGWLRDELLMAGACGAHLCGSGSAVYGIAADLDAAERIAARMRLSYSHTHIARSLTNAEADPLGSLPI